MGVRSSVAQRSAERVFVDRLGIAAPLFVGTVNQQSLLQQIGASSARQPVRTKGFDSAPNPSYALRLVGERMATLCVPVGVQHVAQVGRVLSEAARAFGGGHEERDARGSVSGRSSSFMKSPTVTLAG